MVDASVGVKESDEQLWEMLQQRRRSLMVVLTKIDKVDAEGLNRSGVQVQHARPSGIRSVLSVKLNKLVAHVL